MARIQFTSYRHSKLATLVSLVGALLYGLCILMGIALVVSEFSVGSIAALAVMVGIAILIKVVFDRMAEGIALRKAKKLMNRAGK